jgi:hypothetical protein
MPTDCLTSSVLVSENLIPLLHIMSTPPEPNAALAPARSVLRVERVCAAMPRGAAGVADVLIQLIEPGRGTGKTVTVRQTAQRLGQSVSTTWRMLKSLPLADISNTSHSRQRVVLQNVIAKPASFLPAVVRPKSATYLNCVQEELLIDVIRKRAENEQAIGMSAILQIASDIRSAEKQIPVLPPGRDWYAAFRERHDEFKSLKATKKEYKRADAEREGDIRQFFDDMKAQLDLHHPSPHCKFAMDETGLAGETGTQEKVLVPNEMRSAVQLKGSFREHISMMHICNAAGVTAAPMFMFQGTWLPPNILFGAPPGSRAGMQSNGYFEKANMLAVFRHIVEFTERYPALYYVAQTMSNVDFCSQRVQLLLIVDGAKCHFAADALRYALDWKLTGYSLMFACAFDPHHASV